MNLVLGLSWENGLSKYDNKSPTGAYHRARQSELVIADRDSHRVELLTPYDPNNI